MKIKIISQTKYVLTFIFLVALLIRLFPLSYPSLTTDELRIAFRGYTLWHAGTDELGRALPLIFNSTTDYQLPLASYLAGAGELIFGKSDFGARIVFIIIGSLLPVAVFFLANKFFPNNTFSLICASIVTFSPAAIFLSLVPNEFIILTLLLVLLYLALIYHKSYIFFILFTLCLITSKIAWFVLLPFVVVALYFDHQGTGDFFSRTRLVLLISLTLTLLTFILFLQIPQSGRSLSENNFSIFNDVTIQNDLHKLRGEGLINGWNPKFESLLFTRIHFLTTGLLDWFSSLSLASYFGEFDTEGLNNFLEVGIFPSVFFVVIFFGLGQLIVKKKLRWLIFLLVLTWPIVFSPAAKNLTILTIPFMAVILGLSLISLPKKIQIVLLIVLFLQTLIIVYLPIFNPNQKLARSDTSAKVVSLIKKENTNQVLITDKLIDDTVILNWYDPDITKAEEVKNIGYPYRYKQREIKKYSIIGFESGFKRCEPSQKTSSTLLILSQNDLKKISDDLGLKDLLPFIKPNPFFSNTAILLIPDKICLT